MIRAIKVDRAISKRTSAFFFPTLIYVSNAEKAIFDVTYNETT